MTKQELLLSIKNVMLKQLDESTDTRIFFDEWFLHDLMEKEKAYKDILVKEERPLEMNPLVSSATSFRVLVTPSARKKEEWQVTIFKGNEPMGHREYSTFKEAIEDNIPDWFNQGLWCW